MKRFFFSLSLLIPFLTGHAEAGRELVSKRVKEPPVIDGRADEPAWATAPGIRVTDRITGKKITLKSLHDDDNIFIMVQFPDDTPEREHKNLLWDKTLEIYRTGPKREDSFVIKWNMEPRTVDLTLSADAPYRADIWFWKAARSDHAGHADDKIQTYSEQKLKKAKKMLSKNGQIFYLRRQGDKGIPAYEAMVRDRYEGDDVPLFRFRQPAGSRADVRAKGGWKNGVCTVEFARALNTGHGDDLPFNPSGRYQFGVSIHEIAGSCIVMT